MSKTDQNRSKNVKAYQIGIYAKTRKTEAFRDFVSVKVRNNPNFSAWRTGERDGRLSGRTKLL